MQLLEESARLLYREWFVYLRFPGHEHTKIIDGVPEGWERTTLGACVRTNPQSYKASNLPEHISYIDITSVDRGLINGSTPYSSSDAPGRARRKVCDGDVIWSNVRPNLQAYALIQFPAPKDVVSTGFTVLRSTSLTFTYIYLFVTTKSFVDYLVNRATGSSYPAVRPDDFEAAKIVVPPRTLLTEFHDITEPMFRLINSLNMQNRRLSAARDMLLPRLMSGELTV
jgi:type I restriction enzyme S subunit